jgi:hypothetical protein
MSLPCMVQTTSDGLHDGLWSPPGYHVPDLWSTCGLYTHLPYGYDYEVQPG